jgi:tetratricopeptide (TPR) repeat protein
MKWMLYALLCAVVLMPVPAKSQDAVRQAVSDCANLPTPQARYEACDQAIRSGKFTGDDLAAIYFARAVNLGDLDRWQETIADFDRGLALDPHNATAYAARSYAKSKIGDDAGAAADLALAKQFGWRNDSGTQAGLKFDYTYHQGPYVRVMTGRIDDVDGLRRALAALQPPPGAHGGYGLLGDDALLGHECGYGLRQLGAVARKYLIIDMIRVVQPPGFEHCGVQAGTFTTADSLNDTTLGWVLFDLRGQVEADFNK